MLTPIWPVLCAHPDIARSKKPYGASLNRNNKIDFFYQYNFKTPQILSTNFSPTPHSLKYGWETNVTLTEVHPASPLGLIVNTT